MLNIFAHAGHDHSGGLMQGTNGTFVVAAMICILIAVVIVSALVYDAHAKRRQKK